MLCEGGGEREFIIECELISFTIPNLSQICICLTETFITSIKKKGVSIQINSCFCVVLINKGYFAVKNLVLMLLYKLPGIQMKVANDPN